jgi:hypothetical protein
MSAAILLAAALFMTEAMTASSFIPSSKTGDALPTTSPARLL